MHEFPLPEDDIFNYNVVRIGEFRLRHAHEDWWDYLHEWMTYTLGAVAINTNPLYAHRSIDDFFSDPDPNAERL